jgi:O-glycosyl hydrolase
MKLFLPFLFFVFNSFIILAQEVIVDTTIKYETIEGFGGFGAKKVWWDSAPYWDQEYVNQVIDNLGCTIIRTQIYWESEAPNDNDDPDLINWAGFRFDALNDNNGKQMDFIKAVGEKGARLIATVWTPPIWMKGLEEFYGTYNGTSQRRRPSAADLNSQCSWCGGAAGCTQVGGRLKPEYYAEFAEYLTAYIKTVKAKTGVDVWAINIQNEPMFPNPFESCVVLPSEYAQILKVVGEKFARENITTRLFGPEHMGEWSWGMNRDYVMEILKDPEINPYLSFYAVHSYVDGVAADYGSAGGWTTLHDSITVRYGKQLWMTETSDFEKTGYDLAFSMAKGLHLGLKFGKISGWVYWAMTDYVIKNNQLTSLGYAFKNYYKYIRPMSVQVESTCSDKDILVTTFKKDKKLTVVLINNSGAIKSVNMSLSGANSASNYFMYRTSSTENCLYVGAVRSDSFKLQPNSITTLVSASVVGTGEEVNEENVEILPSTSTGTITLNNAAGGRFTITDISGRVRHNLVINSNIEVVNATGLEPGYYILRVNKNNSITTRKYIDIW